MSVCDPAVNPNWRTGYASRDPDEALEILKSSVSRTATAVAEAQNQQIARDPAIVALEQIQRILSSLEYPVKSQTLNMLDAYYSE